MENHLNRHHQKLFPEHSAARKESGKRKLPETIAVAAELKTPKQTKISDFKPVETVKWEKNNKTSKQIDDRILRIDRICDSQCESIIFLFFANYQGFFVNKRCFLRYWGLKVGLGWVIGYWVFLTYWAALLVSNRTYMSKF
jgi:hypothetical protein